MSAEATDQCNAPLPADLLDLLHQRRHLSQSVFFNPSLVGGQLMEQVCLLDVWFVRIIHWTQTSQWNSFLLQLDLEEVETEVVDKPLWLEIVTGLDTAAPSTGGLVHHLLVNIQEVARMQPYRVNAKGSLLSLLL